MINVNSDRTFTNSHSLFYKLTIQQGERAGLSYMRQEKAEPGYCLPPGPFSSHPTGIGGLWQHSCSYIHQPDWWQQDLCSCPDHHSRGTSLHQGLNDSPWRPWVPKHQTTCWLQLHPLFWEAASFSSSPTISQKNKLLCLMSTVLQQTSILSHGWAASALEADPTSTGEPRYTIIPENQAAKPKHLCVPWLLLIIPSYQSTPFGSSSNIF